MKKTVYLLQVVGMSIVFASAAYADGWGHHHHHHGWRPAPQVNNYYYPAPRPRPQVNNYYYARPQPYYRPPVAYYPPQPYYGGGSYGPSHQGLAGGVIGTVFGYELGNGHPLAAGIGAAAGSFLGNGVGWRY